MKRKITKISVAVALLAAGSVFAQGMPPHHGLWPDSLQTVTLTGTVIVDEAFFHPSYFLDEDLDGISDYHLSFGPWWYQPASAATRPAAGETVTVVAARGVSSFSQSLVVFELNGEVWREAVGYGRTGWNGQHFWSNLGDSLTVTGTTMIDTTYFYSQYFLDTNSDSLPDYRLGFGPSWYEPVSGARRPGDGEIATIFGRSRAMAGIDLLAVYEINGLAWRPLDQPAPWSGAWMHRGHTDSSFAYCVTDSANWIGFAPGHMGGGMGGMMWPDSSFLQFWEIHPDSLPGDFHDVPFMGFYLNVHDPSAAGMMDGRFGRGHGMMTFQNEHQVRFQYYDADLQRRGLTEESLTIKSWDDTSQQWRTVAGTNVDMAANTVTFSTSDLTNYYSLAATTNITAVEDGTPAVIPPGFSLQQNYPNPFNPATNIVFELPGQAHVQLGVYNLLGQRVSVLLDESRPAGVYKLQWQGRDASGKTVPSGVYLLRLQAGGQVRIRSMTLLK